MQNLKVDETIAKLGLKPGMIVADSAPVPGSSKVRSPKPTTRRHGVRGRRRPGTARRHQQDGARSARAQCDNGARRVTDPALPASDVDVAFINDVLHHIEDRSAYLKNLARYIKPAGRIALIDFHPELGGHRNQPELQVSKDRAHPSWPKPGSSRSKRSACYGEVFRSLRQAEVGRAAPVDPTVFCSGQGTRRFARAVGSAVHGSSGHGCFG